MFTLLFSWINNISGRNPIIATIIHKTLIIIRIILSDLHDGGNIQYNQQGSINIAIESRIVVIVATTNHQSGLLTLACVYMCCILSGKNPVINMIVANTPMSIANFLSLSPVHANAAKKYNSPANGITTIIDIIVAIFSPFKYLLWSASG